MEEEGRTGETAASVVQSDHHYQESGAVPPWPSWTIAEAAEQTGYNPEYLRQLCRAGVLECTKAGQMFLIRISSLMHYMEDQDPGESRRGPRRKR
jgi:excisionase family DNA binding protein